VAKHPAKCPKCGQRLEFDSAVDERIVCSRCGVTLAVPGKGLSASQMPMQTGSLPDRDPLIGQTLGEFQVLELLGRGGMGAVYKAVQTSLDRFVAIKILPQRLSRDASFVERFSREARAAAAVTHASIIEVFAVGHDKGFQYIAMEFIEGETVDGILRREGRIAPDRALDIMRQATSALAAAHDCGILHRDLKPSNLLVTSRGRVKIADFGLAKHEGVDVSVTVTGQALGTPLYMPPEAARGERYDARSDLYSLGATFYQMLAGRPPFMGTSATEVVLKHAEAHAPALQDLCPDAPDRLCRIIHRLLAKHAAHRYSTADKLLDALNRVVPVGGVSVPRVPVGASTAAPTKTLLPSSPRPPKTEHRTPPRSRLLLLGGLAAALVLIVVLILVLRPKGDRPPSAVVPPGTRAPSTAHRPPPPSADPAEAAFRAASSLAANGDWPAARAAFDAFESTWWKSRFYVRNKKTIDALSKRIDAGLRGKPTSPKPGTQHPEPGHGPPPDDDERWTEWEDLFDGKTLDGWQRGSPEEATDQGNISVEEGRIHLEPGNPHTRIATTQSLPLAHYELALDAMRVTGGGDFATMSFPIGSARGYLRVGADIAGKTLSLLDAASQKPLQPEKRLNFETGRWYRLRVRVAGGRVQVWLDDTPMFDASSEHPALETVPRDQHEPFLIVTSHKTNAALRSIRLRRLKPEPPPAEVKQLAPGTKTGP